MTTTTAPATQRRVLTAAIAGASGAMLAPLMTGTLAARLREDIGVGPTQLGLVLGAFFLTSAALSPLGGRLADRLGWASALRIGGVGSAVSLLFVATVADGVPHLVAGLVLGGAALSIAMPSSSLAISAELPTGRQGLMFGVKQTAVPLAGLAAGLAVPTIALTVGWRWAFGAAALVPLAAVLVAPVRAGVPGAPRHDPSGPARPRLPRAFGILALGGALAAVAVSSLATFLVISAVDAGIAEGVAGLLAGLASVAGMATRVTVGHLADRQGSGGLTPTAAMMLGGVLGFGLLAVHAPPFTAVGAVLGYVLGWGWPGLLYFGAVVHFPQRPGVATGAVQAGLSGGSAAGPLLFGFVVDAAGFRVAWLGAAVAIMLGAALIAVGSGRVVRP